ncbi:MAG: hypothetical protein MI975_18170 [Cytophagales bacterium]|nr:hypothetical protein [Cytophagales bacterium]
MREESKSFENEREDLYGSTSEREGLKGAFERFIRRFRGASFFIALTALYLLVLLSMGISATPGVYLFMFANDATADWPQFFHYLSIGCSVVSGFFLYGLTMIFVVPLFNFLMPFRVKPFRGNYFSLSSIPWYFHNAFLYVVRYTFLEFFTPTPLNILFYRMMGMKIGKHSHINTTNISDAALIEIGEKVTIGGSATIFAHYASKGYLVVEPVKIGDGATVGIKATVMGDVEIGARAMVGPHEVVMPKTRIPAMESI